jgi:hypothetical protein
MMHHAIIRVCVCVCVRARACACVCYMFYILTLIDLHRPGIYLKTFRRLNYYLHPEVRA